MGFKGSLIMIPKFLDNSLGFNVDRVAIIMRRELIHVLKEFDLSPEQWQVMVTLWYSDNPLTQSEIAKMTLKDKPSVSRMILKLEAKGWIKKQQGEKDARHTFITLTKKGEEYKSIVTEKVKISMAERYEVLSDQECNKLYNIMRKLRRSLDDL